MPVDPKSDEFRAAIKEGLREWLDEQFAAFGKFALMSALAVVFSVAVYLSLIAAGWKK